MGETFSGVDYGTGLVAAAEFTGLVSGVEGLTPAQAAIAWVWQQPGVSTVIPGARNPRQAISNAGAGKAAPLPAHVLDGVRRIYDQHSAVHPRW